MRQASDVIRMPLVSKKDGRISPYDVLLFRPDWGERGVSLPEPIPKLYNGIDGVVIIGAAFSKEAVPCAVRLQGLNCNIANKKKNPMDAEEREVQKVGNEYRYVYDFLGRYKMKKVDNTQEWLDFMKGLKRGMAHGFGPTVYAQFEAVAGLVNEGNKRNDPRLSLRDLVLGVNAVEMMKATLWDYASPRENNGALDTSDFEQFVQLYTRMRAAYNKEYGYPKFPKDLHANNVMYKLVDGSRVWLFTDIDESPDYMQPNTDDPRTMATKMFNGIGRPDAMRNPPPRRVPPPPKPVTPPKPAAVKKKTSPRKVVLPPLPTVTLAEQHAMMMEVQRKARAEQARITADIYKNYKPPAAPAPRKASSPKKPASPTLAEKHAIMMEAQRRERERLEALAALRAAEAAAAEAAAAAAAAAAPVYFFKPASRKPSPKKKPSPPKAKKRSSPKKKNMVPTSSYLARLEARNMAILKRAGMAAPEVSPKRSKSSPRAAPMSGVVNKVRTPPRVYKPYSPMEDLSGILH